LGASSGVIRRCFSLNSTVALEGIMKNVVILGLLTGGIFFVYSYFKRVAINRRKKFIAGFCLPKSIREKVNEVYPHLSTSDVMEVMKGLKEYFLICNLAGGNFVSMPSQVVDVAWHEFILFTKQYQVFCAKAFGRFLHHVPAEAMRTPTIAQDGIKRAWRLSCKREKINPDSPSRLPILFNIDSKLNIKNGFFYTPNCKGSGNSGFCAGDIGGGCGSNGCGGNSAQGCGANDGGGCGGGD
jgi:hypothetical protein